MHVRLGRNQKDAQKISHSADIDSTKRGLFSLEQSDISMGMQLEFVFSPRRVTLQDDDCLLLAGRLLRLTFVRHRRAKRYVLRLNSDGAARVTIPRGGSIAEARAFAKRNGTWLERQLLRQANQRVEPRLWMNGTQILFRGELVRLQTETNNGDGAVVRFGSELARLKNSSGDVRPEVERYLWRLAQRELPFRVLELAGQHQFEVKGIKVRNQRSRWGSCSRRRTISLNWRLIQVAPFVRDYIILHELAHLREMNHSRRFWREVKRLCPDFGVAERWLKEHSRSLL